jgi:hypothetical protein
VEQQDRGVQSGEHQVLVVARIGDDRRVVRLPRQILEKTAALDAEFVTVGRVVERWGAGRAAAVDGVEIESGRPRVARRGRLQRDREPGGLVKGDVVVEELTDEGGPGRVRRVVGVAGAERRVGEQVHRPLLQGVLCVEDPTGASHVHQGGAQRRRVQVGERRQVEDPPEPVR